MKLYPDTNLIPWPTFIWRGMWLDKKIGYGLWVVGVLVMVAGWQFGLMLAPQLTALIISLMMVGYAAAIGMIIDVLHTRPVVVYRYDAAGKVCQDHQRWWATDAQLWPDLHKLTHRNKRVLWIDCLDRGRWPKPVPFDPWLAPLPTSAGPGVVPVTGSRVAAIRSKRKHVARLAKYTESDPKEKFQQGLMVGAIAICLVAVLMAANRATEMLGFSV